MSVLGLPQRFVHAVRQWFADGIFRRVFKNAGLMLSGRTATGLLSLATLSLSARGLGLEAFGVFVLLQTYVIVITAFTTFQSWQAVIRYGAICFENNNTPAFQALIKFTTLLDFGGVIFGTAVGYLAVPIIAPYMGWSPEVVAYAQPFSLLVLFSMVATPTGLLRLFDRFDLLAVHTVITPAFRLIGVAVAFVLKAPLWAYLVGWFLAGVIGGVVLVVLGWREAWRKGRLAGFNLSMRGIMAPHGGILRFSVFSNLYTSLQVVTGQMGTFLVGFVAGPAAAGVFKIGRDVATALSKPAELLNQSIYPEFARLGSKRSWHEFARLIMRGAAVGGGAGLVMLLITVAVGHQFLSLFFGPEFATAYAPLVLLVAAAVVGILGFPMDPALLAMGRPSILLRISAVVVIVVYLPMLVILTRAMGPTGAAIATLTASAVTFAAMTLFTALQLRKQPSA